MSNAASSQGSACLNFFTGLTLPFPCALLYLRGILGAEMPRLLVDISAHGFGHLGQTAPVLNALAQAVPSLKVTVRSRLPLERLSRAIEIPFEHVPAASDFGYVMNNAIDLDLAASARRYRSFHEDWNARVASEASWLAARFDAVLANVAYLPLAGAARAAIPAFALSSINWADLFEHSFGREPWAAPILGEMHAAYSSAKLFLCLTPGLPMRGLRNRRSIGPVCRARKPDRAGMAKRLGIPLEDEWLLVAMGGMDFPIDLSLWPQRDRTRYLVPPRIAVARGDITRYSSLEVDFAQLLASSDAIITKPGYGMFVEAACHSRPVLYVPREHWAEEAFLTAWLHKNTRAQAIERDKLMRGELADALQKLLGQRAPPTPSPTGIQEAVAALAALLA